MSATWRDLVRFEPNERVDLPDLTQLQRGHRSDTRSSFVHVLFGSDSRKVLGGWLVEEDPAGASAQVKVNSGTAMLTEARDDGGYEYGVAAGIEGDSFQMVDFTGKPANTYEIWVRASYTSGEAGNRIFWDETIAQEDVDMIDTRYVAAWDVQASIGSPGTEWEAIAEVVWGGATIQTADITMERDMFFEGDEDGGFAQVWGTGTDRNTDRGLYGVTNLYTWCQAVRQQLWDMIGGGNGWYDAIPTDLTTVAAHVALTTDAHSASPTWTGTITTNDLDAANAELGSGHGTVEWVGAPLWASAGYSLTECKWSLHDLVWDPSTVTGPIEYGGADSDYIYQTGGATGWYGPVYLSLNALLHSARKGDLTITAINVQWNNSTAALDGSVEWTIQQRDKTDPQGTWATVGTGTWSGAAQIGGAVPPQGDTTGVIAISPTEDDDFRLKLQFFEGAGGSTALVYGGVVYASVITAGMVY